MHSSILSVDHVTKRYFIGQHESYYALRDGIVSAIQRITRFESPVSKKRKKEFLALQDVSFHMREGDILGIIGPNGAGKSTLLKILSRITRPTSGSVRVKGRVASLLEVGTGFHPELTGRENIYLNGAILGMSQKEIKKKFDEIVSFAETELFLDTPVKHYSSGMYMRLAFSVAAHLESEILLVDEVLSVGDLRFQKKSLGKMQTISREGRTVLFVSHSMPVIEKLCTSALYLANGKVQDEGDVKHVISSYLTSLDSSLDQPVSERKDRTGRGNILIQDVNLLHTRSEGRYAVDDDIFVVFDVENSYPHDCDVRLVMTIYTENQQGLITCDSSHQQRLYRIPAQKRSSLKCTIPSPALNYGIYHINVAIFYEHTAEDWISSVARFTIDSGTYHGIIPDRNALPLLTAFEWKVL